MATAPPSGVKLIVARIANFRSLVEVEVPLSALTVLVGSNNAGKTSFLDALSIAIGLGRHQVNHEDIYLSPEESSPPKYRVALIDVLIRPVDADGQLLEAFPEGSYWTELWGNGIQQDGDLNDFLGVRTRIRYNLAHDAYTIERSFLREWRTESWQDTETTRLITARDIEPIQLQYIDAKRDLEDDLRRSGSFWRRLTQDLGLTPEDIHAFEESLTALNTEIVQRSEVLKHIRENLADLQRVVPGAHSEVDVSPVARRLTDLTKGIDVSFSSDGQQAFPLTRHGMGIRSLASLLVFRAFASWKARQAAAQHTLLHPLLALEEPEAHLHPHAERALHRQISSIPGQKIISTHSPYFAGQVDIEELRLFTKTNGQTAVTVANTSPLTPEDLRKLRRMVIATRGDLLFSKAIVLFEGETEEQALPVWAETYWSSTAHEKGISFVAVAGDGNYFPFIWLAHNFGIKWFVLSDAEDLPLKKLDSALARAGLPDHTLCENVISLSPGNNFESELVHEGYTPELEEAIRRVRGGKGLDDYIAELHGSKGKKGVTRGYEGAEGRRRALLDCLDEGKTKHGPVIAEIIAGLDDAQRGVPHKVRELFEAMDAALKPEGDTSVSSTWSTTGETDA